MASSPLSLPLISSSATHSSTLDETSKHPTASTALRRRHSFGGQTAHQATSFLSAVNQDAQTSPCVTTNVATPMIFDVQAPIIQDIARSPSGTLASSGADPVTPVATIILKSSSASVLPSNATALEDTINQGDEARFAGASFSTPPTLSTLARKLPTTPPATENLFSGTPESNATMAPFLQQDVSISASPTKEEIPPSLLFSTERRSNLIGPTPFESARMSLASSNSSGRSSPTELGEQQPLINAAAGFTDLSADMQQLPAITPQSPDKPTMTPPFVKPVKIHRGLTFFVGLGTLTAIALIIWGACMAFFKKSHP